MRTYLFSYEKENPRTGRWERVKGFTSRPHNMANSITNLMGKGWGFRHIKISGLKTWRG